jgi:uncharacterized protein YgiM (DUF1202 family)
MSKGGITVLAVAAVVFTALGFVLGQVMLKASENAPRVVASETYVQQYVGMALAEMQETIDDLEMRIFSLTGGETPADPTTTQPSGQVNDPAATTPGVATTPTGPTTVKIKANSVNVRSDASTGASRVGDGVAANTVLTYLGQKNDSDGKAWYHVRLPDGKEGWVASWLCYDPE